MKNRTQIMRIIAVVLTIAAAVALWFSWKSGADDVPTDSALAKAWYCHHCNRGVMLAPSEYENTVTRGIHPAYQHSDGGGDMTSSVLVVKCPTCGKVAVAARRCDHHGTIYDPRSADAASRSCPDCEGPDGDRT